MKLIADTIGWQFLPGHGTNISLKTDYWRGSPKIAFWLPGIPV